MADDRHSLERAVANATGVHEPTDDRLTVARGCRDQQCFIRTPDSPATNSGCTCFIGYELTADVGSVDNEGILRLRKMIAWLREELKEARITGGEAMTEPKRDAVEGACNDYILMLDNRQPTIADTWRAAVEWAGRCSCDPVSSKPCDCRNAGAAQERERCAKVAEEHGNACRGHVGSCVWAVAARIRGLTTTKGD
jgi:hypothetical protein